MSTSSPAPVSTDRPAPSRQVRRRRSLPSGRAVVGGFLVALAAVGVFAAYTSATAAPTESYAVATRDLRPGDRITAASLELVPLDLPDEIHRRSFNAVEPLLDTTVVEPILAGELVQEGALVATGAEPRTRTVSFAVAQDRALNGRLRTGELVDVVATFGTGNEACTYLVAASVPLVAVGETAGSLVSEGGFSVSVGLDSADAELAVAHAATAGSVTLVRATDAVPAPDTPRFCTPQPGEPVPAATPAG